MDNITLTCYTENMSYSIKAACALLDVRADTLRKWESRYRLLKPARFGNDYRVYADEDLHRLAAFMKARAEGMPGEEAARRALAVKARQGPQKDPALQEAAETAIGAFDRAALSDICARADAKHGKPGALENVWIPVLSRLGERAMKLKGLDIAKEHFAVAILRESMLKEKSVRGRPQAALSSPEGELHEIGMLALARELQLRKMPFLYLGPNLPVDSLCAALRKTKLRGTILCVSRPLSRPDLKSLVKRIGRDNPETTVYLGGPASLKHANYIGQLGGVFLGSNLELGVEKLLRNLKEGGVKA
jgi:DNA-binding transcriptional MerR regulator